MSAAQIREFFDNLQDRGITTQEDFTCCSNCGAAEIADLRQKSDLGYCFYHAQSRETAAETGSLYLHWGAYSTDDMQKLIVANAIVDEAKSCGLKPEWNGSVFSTIKITGLDKGYFQVVDEKSSQET